MHRCAMQNLKLKTPPVQLKVIPLPNQNHLYQVNNKAGIHKTVSHDVFSPDLCWHRKPYT